MGCGSSTVESIQPPHRYELSTKPHDKNDSLDQSPDESIDIQTRKRHHVKKLKDPSLHPIHTQTSTDESNVVSRIGAKALTHASTREEIGTKMELKLEHCYNKECFTASQQLVEDHPDLKSGFEDINNLMKCLNDDPEMKTVTGDDIRNLTKNVLKRSYLSKDETREAQRQILAEYMSYVKVADAIYKSYSLFLKFRDLEFMTEVTAAENLSTQYYEFVKGLRTILWNTTDANLLFCERVCNSGLLKFFVGDLKLMWDETMDPSHISPKDKWFRQARGILHNCSNNPITRQTIRQLGTVTIALQYLKGTTAVVKTTILLLLANILDEEDNKLLIADASIFTVILKMMEFAWGKPGHRCDGFSVAELAVGLTGLAKNDQNKTILMRKGALPVLVKILEGGSEDEKEKATRCVWELSFDKDNQATFRENVALLRLLEGMKDSPNKGLVQASESVLWALNTEKEQVLEQNKGDKTHQSGNRRNQQKGHVMISYQWGDQKVLKKIKEFLKGHQFSVWMDIDNMEGSTLQAMAEAVQNASVVLVCMSERYKLSQNCRMEAEYAIARQKPVVPLLMQRGYTPDGWLGIIQGTKLYFDFSGKYSFDAKIAELVKELGGGKEGGATPLVKSLPPDTAHASNDVKEWSKKDVNNWLSKIGMESHTSLSTLTGKHICFLRKLSYKAPEFFYGYVKTELKLTNLEDLMNFTEAVENT